MIRRPGRDGRPPSSNGKGYDQRMLVSCFLAPHSRGPHDQTHVERSIQDDPARAKYIDELVAKWRTRRAH